MRDGEVSVLLPDTDDRNHRQLYSDNKLRKYEGTVVLGFSILVVIAVTSFLPRAVATITLVLLVVVFLLIWKRVKRRYFATSCSTQATTTSTASIGSSPIQTSSCLSKVYNDRLVEAENEIRVRLSLEGLIPLLGRPAGGFMTPWERIAVTSAPSDPEKVSKIISILRKKTDKDFVKFCNVLEESGNQHWSACLRDLCKLYDDRLVEAEADMRIKLSLEGLVPLLERPAGGFMTREERIMVTSAPNDPERVSKIISILRMKTDEDFVKFCNILDKSGNQHWIASLRGLCKLYDDRLVEVEAEMRTRLSLEGLIPLLERPAGGFMTQEERIAVTSAPSDPDKVSKIISILRKKADKDFVKFCAILEMSGNKHWATCLRGTDQLSVPKISRSVTMARAMVSNYSALHREDSLENIHSRFQGSRSEIVARVSNKSAPLMEHSLENIRSHFSVSRSAPIYMARAMVSTKARKS